MARVQALQVGGLLEQAFLLLQQGADHRQQVLPFPGKAHPAVAAAQQGEAHFVLQGVDQLAHAGGGVAQALGGQGEAAAFRGGHECFAARCFHSFLLF